MHTIQRKGGAVRVQEERNGLEQDVYSNACLPGMLHGGGSRPVGHAPRDNTALTTCRFSRRVPGS